MKKIIYIPLIIISVLIVIWTIFFLNKNNLSFLTQKTNSWKIEKIDKKETNELTKADLQDKVEVLRNRVKIRDIISKWDNYFQNDQLTLALIKYKDAHKKSPNDEMVIEKIWDTLTEMKKYSEATTYYEQLLKHPNFDNSKYVLSLFYKADLRNKNDVDYIKSKINENINDEEKIFFYTNTLECLEDFHICKKNFNEKLFTENTNIKLLELQDIKTAIETYNNFWLVDIYYKNALIIGTFMKLRLYPISIILWENLLKEKSDYKPILQIVSQSYFELWDYKNANISLKKYFELSPEDSNAAYLLWIINIKTWDYIKSNIFLNKALNLWYKESLNLKRKLIYNYYILENYEKMYLSFEEMLKSEKNITLDDIIPIINHTIENKKIDKAYLFTKTSLNLFPNESLLYAYMWKLELDRWFEELAITYINKWLELKPNNQLLNYYLWLLKIKENKLEEAKIQLEKSFDLDKKSDLIKEIKSEIEKIDNWFYDEKIDTWSWELDN